MKIRTVGAELFYKGCRARGWTVIHDENKSLFAILRTRLKTSLADVPYKGCEVN